MSGHRERQVSQEADQSWLIGNFHASSKSLYPFWLMVKCFCCKCAFITEETEANNATRLLEWGYRIKQKGKQQWQPLTRNQQSLQLKPGTQKDRSCYYTGTTVQGEKEKDKEAQGRYKRHNSRRKRRRKVRIFSFTLISKTIQSPSRKPI